MFHFLRPFGPAVAHASWHEALRAGFGALLGLGLTGAITHLSGLDSRLGLYLIAPFGASSVLIFAVPNSPWRSPGRRSSAIPSRRWSAWRSA
ncbi:MAG: hypothetical protein R3D63_14205 [Paracoccaceae bacterium]